MVPRFKYRFLPIILILFSCVENRIFIQIHPDGQSYFKFESHGDSTDVLDNDYLHPSYLQGWSSSVKIIKHNDDNNWVMTTEGILLDTSILFFHEDTIPLGYTFNRSVSEKWFSIEYIFSLTFSGRRIKENYPKLYEAILFEKPDSLYWLPEALTILMKKGLDDIYSDSLSKKQNIWNQRLVNHLQNSFAKFTSMDELKNIQKDRELFLTNLFKPFKIAPDLPSNLAFAMEKHEKILKSTLDLNDDTFEIKVIMSGQPIFTNANKVILDTLIWNFGLDSLLSDSYTLSGRSVIYTTDRYQKTLISIGILFLILMAILIKKRY
ncbi:MAG: hypothetical protein VYD66_04190 [Candidatus Neomarinimicrobiota bacterium]|nr:hypothetical protein [Candidatus Neomarinimicrobiota bacterium]